METNNQQQEAFRVEQDRGKLGSVIDGVGMFATALGALAGALPNRGWVIALSVIAAALFFILAAQKLKPSLLNWAMVAPPGPIVVPGDNIVDSGSNVAGSNDLESVLASRQQRNILDLVNGFWWEEVIDLETGKYWRLHRFELHSILLWVDTTLLLALNSLRMEYEFPHPKVGSPDGCQFRRLHLRAFIFVMNGSRTILVARDSDELFYFPTIVQTSMPKVEAVSIPARQKAGLKNGGKLPPCLASSMTPSGLKFFCIMTARFPLEMFQISWLGTMLSRQDNRIQKLKLIGSTVLPIPS